MKFCEIKEKFIKGESLKIYHNFVFHTKIRKEKIRGKIKNG